MLKRVVFIVAVGIATVFALPALALGEDGSTDASSTQSVPVTSEGSTTEVSATLSEEVTEESTEETDTTSDEIEPQTASTTSSSSTTTASTAANSTASTQTSLTTAKKSSGKRKKGRKGRKSGKSCSASSRSGGQLAQASAPPLPGCVRLDQNEGDLVLPDGTTLHITETSQGHISFTVSGGNGTFSGRIYVKGGPDSPGNFCDFNGVTAGVCETFTKNGKNYGVSHVDACPGAFVPPTVTDTPEKTGGKEKQKQVAGGRRKKSPTFVAAGESVTPQGETLPFTGLPVAWLLIVGAGLISGGLAIRRSA